MNITLNSNNWSHVKINTNVDGDTIITLVKKLGDESRVLTNKINDPNSEISKSMKKAFDIQRRR